MKWIVVSLLLWPQDDRPQSRLEPLKKLEYFVGRWSFEWTVPDSPLGAGGKIIGTETYRKVLNGHFLESEIEATGAWGPFQGRALMGYNEAEKLYTRYEADSFGRATLKTGPIGSDAGGWSAFYWEATPFSRNGKAIKLKGATFMYSPVNYRMSVQISVDGGPYENFGSPWFRKVSAAGDPRAAAFSSAW